MAKSNSATGRPEAGDDNGGLGSHSADDIVADSRGGVATRAEAGDDKGGVVAHAEPGDDKGGIAVHVEAGDDKGGLVGGQGADDAAGHQSRHFSWTDAGTHASGGDDGTAYSGPVSYLQWQYIWSGHDGRAVSSGVDNAFLHGGDGNDAIAGHGGHNVIDGGSGSNFLSGGTGTDGGADTFFTDMRAGGVVWNTLLNFHAGDDATVWGFQAGVSTLHWSENEGAEGFKGATLHVETHGAGTGIDASITFAGMSVVDAQRMTMSTGSIGDASYLYFHHD